jgi:hypothetical protein
LFEERTIEIEYPTILPRIPPVTPPFFLIINNDFLVRCVERDDLAAGTITLTMVELAFVPVRKPPLKTTGKTECRRRDRFFFTHELG